MQIVDYLEFALPTFGISVATAAWLARTFIAHRLKVSLALQKADFETKLTQLKAEWEGSIRQRVETYLADRAADREYQLEARKRLYVAIGPLRFQLLMACRDLSGRVSSYEKQAYKTDLAGYYGRSFLFCILRPLTIAELIERQIAYADFSMDAGAIDLLRFKHQAFAALTGDILVAGHTKVNWIDEEQHVFFGHLVRVVNALVVADAQNSARCLRFEEFGSFLDDTARHGRLEPFTHLLADFTPESKPLFWLRLVGFAAICNEYINRVGTDIGFERRTFPCADLLRLSADSEILGNLHLYEQRCIQLSTTPL